MAYVLIPSPSLSDGFMPDETRKLSTGTAFTFHFTQAMDQASVEAAYSISPKIDGQFIWLDSKTFQFAPAKPLSIGDSYRVTIGAQSRNWAKKERSP